MQVSKRKLYYLEYLKKKKDEPRNILHYLALSFVPPPIKGWKGRSDFLSLLNFYQKSIRKKEKCSPGHTDGGTKAIANVEGTVQVFGVKRESEDGGETSDVQKSESALRICERQKRRERLQQERERKATIARCSFFHFCLFVCLFG